MRRTDWILVTILVVLLVLIGAILLLPRTTPTVAAPVSSPAGAPAENVDTELPVPAELTAKSGATVAQTLAQQWAKDAKLVSATATWEADVHFAPVETAWSYLYYSPQQQATALISVTDEKANLVRTSSRETPLSPQNVGLWRFDSEDALQAALEHGGYRFLADRSGSSRLTLTLDAMDELRWRARFLNLTEKAELTVYLDVTNGALLDVELVE